MFPVHACVKKVAKSDKYHDANMLAFSDADIHRDLHSTWRVPKEAYKNHPHNYRAFL